MFGRSRDVYEMDIFGLMREDERAILQTYRHPMFGADKSASSVTERLRPRFGGALNVQCSNGFQVL